ncbi:hypothetical protein [Spiroplasma endosymbiont of Nebria brevicollis]|uniref:hypothetical protein n=1 Tax=Spiroplasma endosymbiont of Nebria brevicollis TaxID=3066284 RepID=UPI00313B9BE2
MAKRVINYYEQQLNELKKVDFGAASFISKFNEYVRLFETMLIKRDRQDFDKIKSETSDEICKQIVNFNNFIKDYEENKNKLVTLTEDYYSYIVEFFNMQIVKLKTLLPEEIKENEPWNPQIAKETNDLDGKQINNVGLQIRNLADNL